MNACLLSLFLCASPPLALGAPPSAEKEPTLSDEDKKLLDGLFKGVLFDPKGAQRVSVKVVMRSAWGSQEDGEREGWLVPGENGKAARVCFTDGDSVAAPPEREIIKLDFVVECRKRYAAEPKADDDAAGFRRKIGGMQRVALGLTEETDLTLAAWLYRLGEEGLAAKALARARKGEGDPRERLRSELAWTAFASLIHAYMVRADDEALAHGERLLSRYSDVADKEYMQAKAVVDDLRRRRKKGTFGKEPPEKPPDDFDKWEARKKVAYLIEALEEVDARQKGQPGGVDLAADRRVAALIALGDQAVPDLIDAVEKDDRLTRSVHFFRDFSPDRTVLGVREAALTAVMSILRMQVFEPVATGDNFTGRGEEEAKKTAERLRAYWKEYGSLPFDERMMKVLTDPKSNFAAAVEAADNLAHLNDPQTLGTMAWTGGRGQHTDKPNPAVAKFNNPTVAEAILAALDRDLKAHDASAKDELHDYHRKQIEDGYLRALTSLGDKRIVPEGVKRAEAAGAVSMRRKWAFAAFLLGDPKPLTALAGDFRAGKLELPADPEPDKRGERPAAAQELGAIISTLDRFDIPESDGALATLSDPKHPYYAIVKRQVLDARAGGFDEGPWLAHPFCLPILRQALDDASPTGARYVIEKETLWRKEGNGSSGGGVPKFLADPKVRRTEADERVCDRAAEKLGEMFVTLPLYHPLFNDADERLAKVKAEFDRFAGRYHSASRPVRELLGVPPWNPLFLPEIPPLGRAATAEDVKAGKAIFHLDGKGKIADLKLPAVGTLKKDAKDDDERPRRVLIVQAEAGADGEITYGVIGKGGVRAVSAKEMGEVKPLGQAIKDQD